MMNAEWGMRNAEGMSPVAFSGPIGHLRAVMTATARLTTTRNPTAAIAPINNPDNQLMLATPLHFRIANLNRPLSIS